MGFWLDLEQRLAKKCFYEEEERDELNFLYNLLLAHNMLPKKNRADKKAVEKIFKEGKFINSSFLTFKFILINNISPPRISFIIPKNIAKLAVKRNLLRRCGYSILEKYISQFPAGILGVFVFKKYQDDILILENEIEIILTKIN